MRVFGKDPHRCWPEADTLKTVHPNQLKSTCFTLDSYKKKLFPLSLSSHSSTQTLNPLLPAAFNQSPSFIVIMFNKLYGGVRYFMCNKMKKRMFSPFNNNAFVIIYENVYTVLHVSKRNQSRPHHHHCMDSRNQ